MMKKLLFLLLGLTSILRTEASIVPSDSLPDRQLLIMAKKYQHGIMCEPNPQKAAQIYHHLSQRGNIKATHRLGKMYLSGDGVKQDYKKAFRLINKAAKQGDVNARCDVPTRLGSQNESACGIYFIQDGCRLRVSPGLLWRRILII